MFKNNKQRKLNNAGYSLVELIVMMGIIAALIGVVSLSVTLIFSKDAEAMATIVNDELSDVRSMAMSVAGDFEYVLHTDASNPKGNYVQIYKDGTLFRNYDLKKGVIITATNSSGATILDGSGDVKFTFDKANGSIRHINGTLPTNGDIYTIHFVASINNTKTKDVIVVPGTGRHFIDN